MNKIKFMALISVLCLLFILPNAFALDNDTAVAENDGDILLAKDYYFDANAENDTGDGSISNPFRDLTSQRIEENSNIHLAEGEYNLSSLTYLRKVSITGSDPAKTVINFDGQGFVVKTSAVIRGVTLNSLAIRNDGNITLSNVIFKDSYSDEGGAIKSNSGSATRITIKNCTFSNNYARYGGVLNVKNCVVDIDDSLFISNYALMYGGVIASAENVNMTIKKSRFLNDYAINDAGGVFYLYKTTTFKSDNVEVINCTSRIGGAIASLNSNITLNKLTFRDNSAEYYGGAIYAIYGILNLNRSSFYNNTASIGGALYIDEVYDFLPYYNTFQKNNASKYANAVYSSISEYLVPNSVLDTVFQNTVNKNDVYESYLPDLNVGSPDYMMIQYDNPVSGPLPSTYDLRLLNQVTPVKNQGNNGNCWAFSSLAALESCILKATGVEYDLSEENMKNLMSLYSSYGWSMEPNKGGYDKMGVGYLTGWLGPVNESDDEYYVNGVLSPLLNSIMHIQNIVYLPRSDYTDNAAIKRAIMQYGGVSTSIYWSSSNLKGSSYYYSGDSGANHAVCIVGWNDSYSMDNFKNKPPADGAWIIKNSWGDSSGDNGFYYVSYYDKRCAPCNKTESSYTFVLNDARRYDKNYQHDISGKTDYFYNTTDTVWYRVRYTASANEYLAAVSTYFSKQTSWVLSIYVNNVLKVTKSGNAGPSYSTIDLGEMLKLRIGDAFEIEFKITVDGDAGVPISESVSLNREIYTENMSYISYDGENWADLYYLPWTYPDHTYESQVACIKAFTVLDRKDNSTKIDSLNLSVIAEDSETYLNESYRFRAKVVDSSNSPLAYKTVEFTVNGETFTAATDRQGYATLDYVFDVGNHKIKITSPAEGKYLASSIAVTLNVKSTIVFSDFKVFTYNSGYSAKLIDSKGNPLANAKALLTVGDETYNVTTDSKGMIYHNIDLKSGEYIVIVNNLANDDFASQIISVVDRISENENVTMYYGAGKYYTVRVLGDHGEAVSNLRVCFSIGGEDCYAYTDSKGYASYKITLNPGSYSITASYKGFSVKNRIVVKKTIITKDITVKKGKTIKFTAKILNKNGNIAINKKVKFKFKGKTYKIKTNIRGKATLKIAKKYKAGKYKIKTSCGGLTVSNRITVK